jgi:hypothetical protein
MTSISGTASTPRSSDVGGQLAGNVVSTEMKLLELLKKSESEKDPRKKESLEKEIEGLQIVYKSKLRTLELFRELMNNAHQMMMNLIKGLRLN